MTSCSRASPSSSSVASAHSASALRTSFGAVSETAQRHGERALQGASPYPQCALDVDVSLRSPTPPSSVRSSFAFIRACSSCSCRRPDCCRMRPPSAQVRIFLDVWPSVVFNTRTGSSPTWASRRTTSRASRFVRRMLLCVAAYLLREMAMVTRPHRSASSTSRDRCTTLPTVITRCAFRVETTKERHPARRTDSVHGRDPAYLWPPDDRGLR